MFTEISVGAWTNSLLILSVVAAGCGSSDAPNAEATTRPEAIGTAQSALSVGGNGRTTTRPSQETDASWAPSQQTQAPLGHVMVVYNIQDAQAGASAGWSVTADPKSPGSWQSHLPSDPGVGWPLPTVLSDGFPASRIVGDPTVLGIPYAPTTPRTPVYDRFAFVSMINSTAHGLVDVQIALTTNAGQTFQSVNLVSDAATGGAIDRPVAAVDPTTGEIWVAWKDEIHGAFWIREVWFDAAGGFHKGVLHAITGAPGGIGGARLGVYHDSVNITHLYLAYNTPIVGFPASCPAPNPPMTWYVGMSTDSGASWAFHAVSSDASWPYCVGSRTNKLSVANQRPSLAVSSLDGSYYVAISHNVDGTGESAIYVYMNDNSVVRYLYPGHPTRGIHDAWSPSIAFLPVGASGQIAVAWHDTWDDPASPGALESMRGIVSGGATIRLSNVPGSSPASGSIPWLRQTSGAVDYEGMAARNVAGAYDFVPAWNDERIAGQSTVWATTLVP